MSNGELLSRDELLSGRLQHNSRAAKLLTAIEARTAHMSEETRRAIAAYFVSDEKDFTRRFQLDFLQGVKLVAQSPDHLTVEDLERYAPHWSALVPDDWDLRTALLRLIARRYPLTDPDLPRIGAALGFEVQTVRDAYGAANGQSADSGRAEPPGPLPPRYPRSDQLSEDERLLQEAEAGVEWLHLPAGTVLCREGEPGNSLYILISGRLSAVITGEQGHQQVVGEMSRGEIVGEVAVLTGEKRTTTVSTVRDSELLEISQTNVIRLAQRHPQIMMRLNRVLARRVRANLSPNRRATNTMITLAIIPAGPGVPLAQFARGLAETLAPYGSTLHLNSVQLESRVGADVAQVPPDDPEEARLMAWLSEQEHRYRYVLYEADVEPSEWTSRCLRQADRVLIVADAGRDPARGEIELQLWRQKTSLPTELVLLHSVETSQPRGTRRWLTPRPAQPYHHVRHGNEHDLQRLVRRLIGKAIGVVLSGGGARGFAHVGALRALDEAGIPIDMIGGTSMGSLVGAAYALGGSTTTVSASETFGSRRKLLDATLPLSSFFSTRKVTTMLHTMFEDVQMEDLWRPFFCISSNMTRAEPVVLDEGPVWQCVRASLAIPVIFSPVLQGDDVMIDGGVLNNFPLDIMRGLCESGTVIGVNTSPPSERSDDYHFGPSLSGWQLLLSKLHLASEPVRAPSLFSTLMRTIELNGAYRMQSASFLGLADVLIEPPVERFGILDFSSFPEIDEVGYRSAQQEIELWQRRTSEEKANAAS